MNEDGLLECFKEIYLNHPREEEVTKVLKEMADELGCSTEEYLKIFSKTVKKLKSL